MINQNGFEKLKRDFGEIIVPEILKGTSVCCLGKVTAKVDKKENKAQVVFKDAFNKVRKEMPDHYYEIGSRGFLSMDELVKLQKIIIKEKRRN